MNKGLFQGELGLFHMIFLNSIKSVNESWCEIREIDIFGKRT